MTRRTKDQTRAEQASRFEGDDLIVRRGAREFRLYRTGGKAKTKAAKTDAERRIRCLTCQRDEALGDEAESFFLAHEHVEPRPPAPPAAPGVDIEQLVTDVRAMHELGLADELELLRLVVDGLGVGRPIYGALDVATDQRDLEAEAIAELRDLITYDFANLLRRLRSRAKRAA